MTLATRLTVTAAPLLASDGSEYVLFGNDFTGSSTDGTEVAVWWVTPGATDADKLAICYQPTNGDPSTFAQSWVGKGIMGLNGQTLEGVLVDVGYSESVVTAADLVGTEVDSGGSAFTDSFDDGLIAYLVGSLEEVLSGLGYLTSAVLSVTGDGVDNTDPQNPVITGGAGSVPKDSMLVDRSGDTWPLTVNLDSGDVLPPGTESVTVLTPTTVAVDSGDLVVNLTLPDPTARGEVPVTVVTDGAFTVSTGFGDFTASGSSVFTFTPSQVDGPDWSLAAQYPGAAGGGLAGADLAVETAGVADVASIIDAGKEAATVHLTDTLTTIDIPAVPSSTTGPGFAIIVGKFGSSASIDDITWTADGVADVVLVFGSVDLGGGFYAYRVEPTHGLDASFKWSVYPFTDGSSGGGAVSSVNGSDGDVVLTTADVDDSTDKRYVTDAELVVIGNTSGTNSGNETATTLGATVHGASAKTTPVDADEIPIVDSAASNILKKLTWANLKATLKTYFDTLYPSGSGTSSGTNTGDQTITLTGDVTGSGTGSFVTAIGSGVIVNADINSGAAIALSKLATDPLARANHTGTQTASTISDFNTTAVLAANNYSKYLTADADNATNTLADITDLATNTQAVSTKWRYEWTFFHGNASTSTAGIDFSLTVPTGATVIYNGFGPRSGSAPSLLQNGPAATAGGTRISFGNGTSGSPTWSTKVFATVTTDGTHSGAVTPQFAQTTNTGSTTTRVFKDSTVEAKRIS